MRKSGILVFLVFFPFFSTAVFSATPVLLTPTPIVTPIAYDLPYPGILPDHPLYFLKVFRDKLVDIFTSDSQKRVEFLLLMADKRIAMGQLLIDKGNIDLGKSTISKGEKYFLRATEALSVLEKANSESAGKLREKLLAAYKKHQQIIDGIYTKFDDNEQKKWQDIDDTLSSVGKNLKN